MPTGFEKKSMRLNILCLHVTWILFWSLKLTNYELFNVDRYLEGGSAWGGTAVYVTCGLNFPLTQVPQFQSIESTPITLDIPSISQMLNSAINLPAHKECCLIAQGLSNFSRPFSIFFIAGDFSPASRNTHIARDQSIHKATNRDYCLVHIAPLFQIFFI